MVFSRYLLEFVVVLLVIAVIAGMWPLMLLCLCALLSVGYARIWRRWALVRLDYSRELSAERAFPGDEVTLTVRLANRKLLPLSRIDLFDAVTRGLEVLDTTLVPYGEVGRLCIARTVSLGWYEAASWRYRLRCRQRGLYRIGPLHLLAGDPFGMYVSETVRRQYTRLVVYPRILDAVELGFDMRQLLGDVRSRRRLIVDPVRTAGVRDYHRDDPLKAIHWGATARRGELQTRVYEPTTSLEVICLLDVDTFEHYWEGMRRDQVERLVSIAASLCDALVKQGHSVGLMTNGGAPDQGRLVHVPPSRSPHQLALLLETLAVLMPYSIAGMARLVRGLPELISPGASVVLISAVGSRETQAGLLELRRHGHQVSWVSLANEKPVLPGVVVYHSPPPAAAEAEVA